MNREAICVFVCTVLILVILSVLTLAVLRRARSKRKVYSMGMPEKIRMLNELAEPFGFQYLWEEDIFTSNIDAWQRKHGYEALYDRLAAGANMVIDTWPVYFDYDGRTWLIEFWKGQYGINTGGEVGVYHAKGIVPPHLYKETHYDAAKSSEMPQICCRLERREEKVYEIYARHWWLTGFRMGTFSKPSELRMMTTLSFEDTAMAQAFFEGLQKSGRPRNRFRICGREVYVRLDLSSRYPSFRRIHRSLVQLGNHIYCLLYRGVTRPFTQTADRMLFLYYLVPSCFRRMLRLTGGRYRTKRGKRRRKGCSPRKEKRRDGMS